VNSGFMERERLFCILGLSVQGVRVNSGFRGEPLTHVYKTDAILIRINHTHARINRRETKKMLRPWSQQARQLTPRRETVAHLGNRGCCVHIHTGNLSIYMHGRCHPPRP